MKRILTAVAAAALAGAAVPAIAQETTATGDPYAAPVEEDGNDFPWGLLGLLGLAGLLGRKKDNDVRRTNGTSGTTGTTGTGSTGTNNRM